MTDNVPAVPAAQSSEVTLLAYYDGACRAVAEAKNIDDVKAIRNKAEAMRAYGRVAQNKVLEIDACEIRIRAEIKLGEMITAQKETVGLNTGAAGIGKAPSAVLDANRTQIATLAEAGIDKKLSARAQKLAAIPKGERETLLKDWRSRIEIDKDRLSTDLLGVGKPRGTQGTGENEWYTPADIIEAARAVLGVIDLDPASSAHAQATVQALRHFTLAENGLAQEWHGNVWLNPPYAQPHIADFADKLIAEVGSGRVKSAIMLTHNYTDTAWFQKSARAATSVCFTRGRVRFVSPSGDLAAPTQGQAFFYFGRESSLFDKVFCDAGLIMDPTAKDAA
jgi:phage N-6-adenine-methyltransferase